MIYRLIKIRFMNQGKFVFAQVTSFLPHQLFDRICEKYEGNKYVKHYSCWNQMLSMMYGQLNNRDSLRDLITCVIPHRSSFYHMGFGKNISRSNLAAANEKRDFRIYEEFAYHLIGEVQKCAEVSNEKLLSKIDGPIYALDSTTIDLCLNVFWWAEFRKAKGGIKLHTLLDVKTNIPTFVSITQASVHDVNSLDLLKFENGGFYIIDRAYVDYARLYKIEKAEAFFITRARKNFQLIRIEARKVKKKLGIVCDQTVRLKGFYVGKYYPEKFRKIRFVDPETQKRFVFLTNNFELTAIEIAGLYKYRWKIELFFKWIKQHLKIKSFWGTTVNAVKTQIYIAIITYVIIAIIKNKMKTTYSNYEILQIIGTSLMAKIPLRDLLSQPLQQDFKEKNDIQLKINLL